MQPKQLLVAVLSTVSLVAATCYTGGRASNFNEENSPRIDIICEKLVGTYSKTGKSTRAACYTDTLKSRWDFEISYIGSAESRTIDIAECRSGLEAEAKCTYGGRRRYSNWEYMSDPNEGACPRALEMNMTSIVGHIDYEEY
ncbi:hypothetical protein CTRI78_v002953 [Colletotrichum trifolii]|uniref:Secreted protein n=1 Tax=Colletotrichum trifolii TaxID=5466 RepID=A0A4V6QF01_COLTR|nr:hypothetical protein CTRI78_v002953 [Colletotrichum trifolii]